MILLTHTIDSIEHVIRINPSYGLIATFIISFIESLAIIGSVVPGSVTMSIIGSLIGAAILPLLPTLGLAFLGSYTGDILSFVVGKKFQPRINSLNWVKNNKPWISKAEIFIQKYGVASIIIGRFFGPMRSMVPMIAGALRMNNLKFLLAAIPSAALWAIVYLIPGIIIGMFSSELELFSEKSIIIFITSAFTICLAVYLYHKFAQKIKRQYSIAANRYLPQINISKLNILLFGIFNILIFCLIAVFESKFDSKYALYYFSQSLHTVPLNYFMSLITLLADKYFFIGVLAVITIFLEEKETKFILISSIICLTLTLICKHLMHIHRPPMIEQWNSFPSGHSIRISFLLNYLYLRQFYSKKFKRSIWVIIAAIAVSRLYLGAHWWPDVIAGIAFGTGFIYLAHFISKSKPTKLKQNKIIMVIPIILYISLAYYRSQTGYMEFFLGEPKTIELDKNMWLKGNNEIPAYLTNRFNRAIEPLTIQWLGKESEITDFLHKENWQTIHWPKSWLNRLSESAKNTNLRFLPALPKLHNNKAPSLIATKNDGKYLTVITLWQSKFKVDNKNMMIGNTINYLIEGQDNHKTYHKDKVIKLERMGTSYIFKYSNLILPPIRKLNGINGTLAKIY